MKKIPTLFERDFSPDHRVKALNKVTPGLEGVLRGEGEATIKVDGTATAMIDGRFYKRFDAKNGRKIPEGAIECDKPDPVTGHWPHWVPVDWSSKEDCWFVEAFNNADQLPFEENATYEAVGPHFNGNPHKLPHDTLWRHGELKLEIPDRSYEGIRDFLKSHNYEGIVFWKDGRPWCKIKRTDFGFKWPVR